MNKFPPKVNKAKAKAYGPANQHFDKDTDSGDTMKKPPNGAANFMGGAHTPGSKATVDQSSGSGKGVHSGAHIHGGVSFDNGMKKFHHDGIEHDSGDR